MASIEFLFASGSSIRWLAAHLGWLRQGVLALSDQGLISGANFLIGIVLARWLVPEQYGRYALAFSIFLFLSSFHNALLLEPMSVFGPASYGKHLPAYVGKLIGLHVVVASMLALILGAGVAFLHRFTSLQALKPALLGVCVSIPLILFFWLCRRAAYLQLAPHLAAGSALAYCLVLISLLLLVKKLEWLSPFTAFLIQSCAATAAAALLLIVLKPKLNSGSGPTSSAIARQHWRYGRWVVATAFVYWLSGNAYYLVAAALLRMEDVAGLRALQNFTLPSAQFSTAISLLVLPLASGRLAEEDRQGFQRRIRQITLLFIGVAVAYLGVLWLFGGRLIAILYAGRYTEFAYLLPLVAAPVVVTAASQGSCIALQAMQCPADVFLAYTAAGIVTIVTGIPLTRYWGLAGAAVGILMSSLAYFIAIAYRYRARLKGASHETSIPSSVSC